MKLPNYLYDRAITNTNVIFYNNVLVFTHDYEVSRLVFKKLWNKSNKNWGYVIINGDRVYWVRKGFIFDKMIYSGKVDKISTLRKKINKLPLSSSVSIKTPSNYKVKTYLNNIVEALADQTGLNITINVEKRTDNSTNIRINTL